VWGSCAHPLPRGLVLRMIHPISGLHPLAR
jgi:hypothetical protein